jgi:putative aldouronate transport system permease protein
LAGQIAHSKSAVEGKEPQSQNIFRKFLSQIYVQAMVIPGIIWMIIFCYIPIYGLIIAFKQFDIVKGIMGSPWVGLANFKEFIHSENLFLLLRNTLGLSLLNLLLGFPLPIIFALFLNELKVVKFKKFVQTASYLPYFISWVIIGGMFLNWLSAEGMVNELLIKNGIISDPKLFMNEPVWAWIIMIATNIWKHFGWNSIIFLAAISSVDQEMYEAAIVDGANRFQRMWKITLPAIKSTVVIMFIISLSSILNSNFDQIIIMRNSIIRDYVDVIDTYTYDIGLGMGRYSYAAAVGLLKSVIALFFLWISNAGAKKFTDSQLF